MVIAITIGETALFEQYRTLIFHALLKLDGSH
jgi:hypothetical protein